MSSRDALIVSLQLSELRIPFTVSFRHASAERSETATAWVHAVGSDGAIGFGESCPRPYVTGETLETVGRFLAASEKSLRADVVSVETLRRWIERHRREIDENPAAWCAIELAILDLLGRRANTSVEELLSLPPLDGRFRYTAVLGDAPVKAFHAMAEKYRQFGFTDFKVKLSGRLDHDTEKLAVFKGFPPSIRVRADANNAFGF